MMAMAKSFIELPSQQYFAGEAITTTTDDLLSTSPRRNNVLVADRTPGTRERG
jgi:hypothetical protein